jgi:trk system potassium uptake protein
VRRPGPGINWRLVLPVVASALGAVGLGMVVCLAIALVRGDGGVLAFAAPAAAVLALAAGGLAWARRLRQLPLRPRDGFLAVSLAWLAAGLAGAAPFLVEGTFTNVARAIFESMSGITTTGATVITDIEAQPDAILFWRSLTQWLGGAGIVVLVVAVAPATGLASSRVFFAETSGVTADRLTPRIADTAKIVWGLYLAFTFIGLAAYLLAGMRPFDAVNHTFTSVATGGFSTRNASIAAFDSLAVELVALGLMVLGAINFAFYYRVLRGMSLWPQAGEVRIFLAILAGAIAVVTLSLALDDPATRIWAHLREAAFSVTSVMTGTGYTTADFDAWNDFGRAMVLLLMFVGGCAGSAAGGLKVIRVLLLAKIGAQEITRQLRPRAVQVLRIRNHVYSEELRRGVLGFAAIYLLVVLAGTLAMLAAGLDLVSAFAAAAATVNIVGPGLGEIGAFETYASVSDGGLLVLTFLMLAGRLEVFTLLVLLTPAFWRRNIA